MWAEHASARVAGKWGLSFLVSGDERRFLFAGVISQRTEVVGECFTHGGVVLPSRPEAGRGLPLRPWGRRVSEV